VRVQHRYQWLYVYGFACPKSGATHWLLLPTVSIEVFAIALAHFAQATGAGPDRRIILVLDRAGWHSSQTLVIPHGIHLVFLPPYSPELQPCERLWPLSNEAIANRRFETLDELQEVQAERCLALQNNPTGIRHITLAPAGGLPRSPKVDGAISKPIFQQTPPVCLTFAVKSARFGDPTGETDFETSSAFIPPLRF
jgi:hypothetical protein